jgi:predicted nuclease of restriction endonuclease-like (RecB) superfamily
MSELTAAGALPPTLHAELRALIAGSRQRLAGAVNAELTRLYWSVGQRLATEVLGGERASYGSKVMAQLGQQLSQEFGRGFEARNLRRMAQFAQAFPDAAIVSTLSTQLSWSHFVVIVVLKAPEARSFYAQRAAQESWSVRELALQIERKAFERTAIADAQVAGSAPSAALPSTPNQVFKDPHFLDCLGLRQGHDEADLEAAILRQLEAFILELGRGFAFVERQKRMVIDGEDFYLDLLFYHRRLRRLVAIELKLGRFKAAHKGQMELYLKWLDKHERQDGEAAPIGLILCAEASREQVELLQMHQDGITEAEYWTELPPKAELERQLHAALVEGRERLARRGCCWRGERMTELPASWFIAPLGDLPANIIGGGTPSKAVGENFRGLIPFMTVKDMHQRLVEDAQDHIRELVVFLPPLAEQAEIVCRIEARLAAQRRTQAKPKARPSNPRPRAPR